MNQTVAYRFRLVSAGSKDCERHKLPSLAKEVIARPPEVIEGLKKVSGIRSLNG
jgi:hypothetical protein